MNTTTSALQLPGASRLAGPMRETGASALDRRTFSWPAPDPATVVLDPWGPPSMFALVAGDSWSPWPAPLASARLTDVSDDGSARVLAPPHHAAVPISTVEPTHAVGLPDLVALARDQGGLQVASTGSRSTIPSKPTGRRRTDRMARPVVPRLPTPTPADLVQSDVDAARAASLAADQSGASGRLLAAVVVGVGLCAALGAALATIL